VNDMAHRYESLVSSLEERFRSIATEARDLARQDAVMKKSMLLADIEAVEQILEKCTFKKKGKAETA